MKIDGWTNDSTYKKINYRIKKNKGDKKKFQSYKFNNKGSILKIIVILLILFFVWNHFRYHSEIKNMMGYIENRQYTIALDYYTSLEKDFSKNKMLEFNYKLSKKMNKFLEKTGDDFFDGSVSKEEFTGFVNMVNSLSKVDIKSEKLLKQCEKASNKYSNGEISYDTAKSFVDSISALQGMEIGTEKYRQDIESVYDSRKLYEQGYEYQNKFQYSKAIENYKKVLKMDKKYYKKAEENQKECIEKMYDYYLQEASSAAKLGNYQLAIEDIEYIKKYYPDDKEIDKILKSYQKKLSEYTLGSDDIKNTYCQKSGMKPEEITVSPLPQMVDEEKYYYAEILKDSVRIDEILIRAEDKKLYSYKDGERSYNNDYNTNFFKLNIEGKIEFAITKEEAENNLKNELEKKKLEYKKIESIELEKAERYFKGKKDLNEVLNKKENTYFFFIGNKGFLRGKDLYCIDMYSGRMYSLKDNHLTNI